MDKWEYLYIDANKNDVNEINGKSIYSSKDSLPGYMNELGEQGWELASSFVLFNDNLIKTRWRLVFKRKKQ